MAEEAFAIDLAPKVRMIPAVVTGIHGPESAVFGIPGDGRLDELTVETTGQFRRFSGETLPW